MLASVLKELMKLARRYSFFGLFSMLLTVRFLTGLYMDDQTEEISQFWEPLHLKIFGTSLSELTDTNNHLMNILVSSVSFLVHTGKFVFTNKVMIYQSIKLVFSLMSALNQTFLIHVTAKKIDNLLAHLVGYLIFITPGFYELSSSISYGTIKMHICMLALSIGIFRRKIIIVPLVYFAFTFCSAQLAVPLLSIVLLCGIPMSKMKSLMIFTFFVACFYGYNKVFKIALSDLIRIEDFGIRFNKDTFTYVFSNLCLNFNVLVLFLTMFVAIPGFKEILEDAGRYIDSSAYITGFTALLALIFACFGKQTNREVFYLYPIIAIVICYSWSALAKTLALNNLKQPLVFFNILLALGFTMLSISRIVLLSQSSFKKELFASIPKQMLNSKNKVICYPRDWIDFPSNFWLAGGYTVSTLGTADRDSQREDLYVTTDKCDIVIRWDFRRRMNITGNKEESLELRKHVQMFNEVARHYMQHFNGTDRFEFVQSMLYFKQYQIKNLLKMHEDYILDELDDSWELTSKRTVRKVESSTLILRSFWIPGLKEEHMQRYNYKIFTRKSEL